MRDAHVALDGRDLERVLQRPDLADGANPRQLGGGGQNREAGRVVAAVLEAAQSLHENGHGIPLSDHTDDSAHELLQRAWGAKRVLSVPQDYGIHYPPLKPAGPCAPRSLPILVVI